MRREGGRFGVGDGVRERARALAATRRWFESRGYLEVPTPVRVPSPAMEEQLFALECEGLWLRTSPELALKRAVASGLPRVYELGPCFRGRESGDWHGTEFLMLEWYRVGAGLSDLMDEVESLVGAVAEALGVPSPGPWRRVTVRALFQERVGLDLATASVAEISPRESSWDDAFFRRWVEDVEPTLTGATFLTEWPASMAALAQRRTDQAWPVAQRFEAFLGGVELANAFFELGDREEQARRWQAAQANREAAGEVAYPLDADFLDAVGALPTTAGIALGFDRLVAALCGWDGIGRGRVG